MSYFSAKPTTEMQVVGKKIYDDALYDRKGFHEFDIDADIWLDIFQEMGEAAFRATQRIKPKSG